MAFVTVLACRSPAHAQDPATPPQPGLLTFWSSGVSHATNLGEVDWSKYTSVTVETAINWPVTNNAFYSGGPTDYFAARMVGKIEIPRNGAWTFGLSSDAGARLFIDGKLVVNDDANHSFRRTTGRLALQAGTYSIEIRYLEVTYSQGLVLDWSGPGDKTAVTVPASAFSNVPATANAGSQNNGLRAYWSSGVSHATRLGEVDWTQYDTSTVEPSVSWSITNSAFYTGGPTDYFALKLKGTITIAEAGVWQFKLGSDAGARLFVGGQLVVNDDANHSFRFTSGTVNLTAGTHNFEIRYLEVTYSQGLIATWKSPTAAYEEVIPSYALTPATIEPPGQQDGNGLNAYWSNGVSHATRLGQVDWTRYDTATTVSNVSWKITNNAFYSGGPTDYFAVALIGELTVPSSGLWRFKIGSDAGAQLLIDGVPVINDDANHSFRFTAGTVNLTAGVHRFEVRYL
ncbi:MAG: PA14 domain-containing protein, partial [bacterium]|nr:PA14 domain-containing protein [bacterium]